MIQHYSTSVSGQSYIETEKPESFQNWEGYDYINHSLGNYFSTKLGKTGYVFPQKPVRASVIKLEPIRHSRRKPKSFTSTEFYKTTEYFSTGNFRSHALFSNSKSHYKDESTVSSDTVLPNLNFISITKPVTKNLPNSNTEKPYDQEKMMTHNFGVTFPELKETSSINNKNIVWSSLNSFTEIPWGNTENVKYFENYYNNEAQKIINFKKITDEVQKVNESWRLEPKKSESHEKSADFVTNLTVEGLSKAVNKTANTPKDYVPFFDIKNFNLEQGNFKKSEEYLNTEITDEPKNKSLFLGTRNLRLVNLDDELSLDAKILKDTNWDGLVTTESGVIRNYAHKSKVHLDKTSTTRITTPIDLRETTKPTATTETILWPIAIEEMTSTIPIKKRIHSFDEIKSTIASESNEENNFWDMLNKTRNNTKTLRKNSDNLSEESDETLKKQNNMFAFASTTTITKINMSDFTEIPLQQETISKNYELLNETIKKYIDRGLTKSIIETTVTLNRLELETTTPEDFEIKTSRLRNRKYKRKPMTRNFSSFPPSRERKEVKNIAPRNYFPKRQKPNITLTFGSKKVIRKKNHPTGQNLTKLYNRISKRDRRKSGIRWQFLNESRLNNITVK